MEYWEVQSKAKFYGVICQHAATVSIAELKTFAVRTESSLFENFLALKVIFYCLARFWRVPIVIADHFVKKCSLLHICYLLVTVALFNSGYDVVDQYFNNVSTVFMKTFFNHAFVTTNAVWIMLLILLLYGGNSAPCCATWCNKVFKSYRKHWPFFWSEVISLLKNGLQECQHVIKSFSLLCQSSHEPFGFHLSGIEFLFWHSSLNLNKFTLRSNQQLLQH